MNHKLTLWVTATVTAALLAPTAATAQVGRYKRKQVKVEVKQTEKTKELEAKKPEQDEKAAPEITADEFIQIETKVQSIRDEQIREYIALIRDTDKDDPERPDLLFRLAELYAQKQRHLRFNRMETLGKADQAKTKSDKTNLLNQAKSFETEEKKWLVQSIKVYKQIADNPAFKDYARMDQALFYYAYTLQSAKYDQEARKVFYRLIKDYPNSQYIPDAYLSFADYYFNDNSLANAEKFYDKVLQFPKSSVYAYAMYKKGWVYLNLDRPQDALETFFKVAQITEDSKKNRSLNKAAKKDFVRAYAEVGKPQLAYKAFQRVDQQYSFTMLEILGDLYLDQGKAEKTIYVYHELMGLEPKNPKVCDWQYTVARAMMTVGTPEQKVKEIERLDKLYTFLKDKKILDEGALFECRDNAQATTGELAKIWHQESVKTLNTETLQYVDSLYKLYMTEFSDAEDYGEMQFYYGELLWMRAESEKNPRLATELWENAAIQFTDVVKAGKVNDDLRKESAYAAVLGWKNALAVDPRTKAPPIPDEDDKSKSKDEGVPKPEEIPEREMKMVAAFDVYIEYIKDPKDEELVSMKFLKGRTYWRYKHYEEAIPLFEDILENHIDSEPAEWSANLLLDSLNRSKEYDLMVTWVDKLLAKKDFLEDRDELAERLDLLKAQSMRKAAEQLEEDGSYVQCGERYREIFNRSPKAEGMEEVLYNAGVCYEKGRSIGLAIAMREQLIKRYPDAPLAKKALVLLGGNYGAIAYYPQAAEKFEEYSKRFGGEKDASAALSNAVFYRKGIGQDELAIKDIEYFVKQYSRKESKQAAAALYGMTGIYEKNADDNKVVKHLQRYLKEFGNKGGIDREIAAHAKLGEILWKQSCPAKGVDGACISVERTRAIAQRRKGKRSKGSDLPTQCGPESKIKLTVTDRRSNQVKEAEKHFRTALKLWQGGKALAKVPGETDEDKAGRQGAATYFAAMAAFYLSEQEYESFLQIKFPDKLNFDAKKPKEVTKSQKRLLDYKKDKEKALAKTKQAYLDLLEFKRGGEAWAIAGAARVGQLWQNFSDQIFTAQIPPDVRSGPYAEDAVFAYCDALTEMANPLEQESVNAYAFCLDESTKRNWFNSWSRLCESELGQIRPLDFPTAAELHAQPNKLGDVIALPAAIGTIAQ